MALSGTPAVCSIHHTAMPPQRCQVTGRSTRCYRFTGRRHFVCERERHCRCHATPVTPAHQHMMFAISIITEEKRITRDRFGYTFIIYPDCCLPYYAPPGTKLSMKRKAQAEERWLYEVQRDIRPFTRYAICFVVFAACLRSGGESHASRKWYRHASRKQV